LLFRKHAAAQPRDEAKQTAAKSVIHANKKNHPAFIILADSMKRKNLAPSITLPYMIIRPEMADTKLLVSSFYPVESGKTFIQKKDTCHENDSFMGRMSSDRNRLQFSSKSSFSN